MGLDQCFEHRAMGLALWSVTQKQVQFLLPFLLSSSVETASTSREGGVCLSGSHAGLGARCHLRGHAMGHYLSIHLRGIKTALRGATVPTLWLTCCANE